MDVIVYPSASDKTKNRGFAFVEYDSHRSAAMARRKLMNGRVQLWGHSIAVDWAEPELEVAAEIMSQVSEGGGGGGCLFGVLLLRLCVLESCFAEAMWLQRVAFREPCCVDYSCVVLSRRV